MAGEGKNQVASSLLDLQPTAALEFFQIFPDPLNFGTNRINFHGGTLFGGVITWQGIEYIPTALEGAGWETYGDKRLARPTLRISNENNQITRLLQNYQDLVNAHVVRKRAFVKNLDDVNFGGGNPFGTANPEAEISSETWLMGQKLQENKVFVEFELNSPLDLESFDVNYRSITAKHCYWQYRGEGCRYVGLPIERADGELFTDPTGEHVVPIFRHQATDPMLGGHGAENFFDDPYAQYNINRAYEKGDITVLDNNKVLIPPYGADLAHESVKLKTVYVCVNANSGQYPEGNPSYWQKDGCTKKLGACRKRFNDIENLGFYGEGSRISGFRYISLSGTSQLENEDGLPDTSRAGMFYSRRQDLTGKLISNVAGPNGVRQQWTIAGWAQANTTQSEVAGVFSTTRNTGNNGHLYDWLNVGVRSGASNPDHNTQQMGGFYRQNVEDEFVALNFPYNPADGLPVNLDASVMDLGAVNGNWYFYAIKSDGTASVGPPAYENSGDGTNISAFVGSGPKLEKLAFLQPRGGPKLFKNEDSRRHHLPYGTELASGYLPTCFMLGAIPYGTGSGLASMNGKLGPWMFWDRALDDDEIDFLYKDIDPPANSTNPITQVPRPFEDCTGLRAAITGIVEGVGLVAWWDMQTAPFGSEGALQLLDRSENNHRLYGSGFPLPNGLDSQDVHYHSAYNTGELTYTEHHILQQIKNPTSPYPRFGGYPGTDGFGYG